MAVVQDDLYVIAGYSNNKGYASSAWRLHLASVLGEADRVRSQCRHAYVHWNHVYHTQMPSTLCCWDLCLQQSSSKFALNIELLLQPFRTENAPPAEATEASQWQSTKRRKENPPAAPCLAPPTAGRGTRAVGPPLEAAESPPGPPAPLCHARSAAQHCSANNGNPMPDSNGPSGASLRGPQLFCADCLTAEAATHRCSICSLRACLAYWHHHDHYSCLHPCVAGRLMDSMYG